MGNLTRPDKLPAFQFYPSDWRSDPGIQALSFEDRAVWFEILCLMHESPRRGVLLLPNGMKMQNDALSRILGFPLTRLVKSLDRIAAVGVSDKDEETGALMNRRMVRDEHVRAVRTEAGRLGGNPNLLKQNPTKQEAKDNQGAKQKTTPSSSSSSSDPPTIPQGTDAVKYSAEFDVFWKTYPRHDGKGAAFKAWSKLRPSQALQTKMIQRVETQKLSEQWRRENGQFIPHASTWINESRFDDDSGQGAVQPKLEVVL